MIIRLSTPFLFNFKHACRDTTSVSAYKLAFMLQLCVEYPLIKAARSVTIEFPGNEVVSWHVGLLC